MPAERLLTQNSELRRIGVWNWTLPAWAGRLPDGRTYNTCPHAGVCAKVCYARNGTYRFPDVLAKHERNLMRVLDDPWQWMLDMVGELSAARFRAAGVHVRIHDAGDFFTDDYLLAWLRISRATPYVIFYCYTKEVERFRRLVEPNPPRNFLWCYSYGGRQDHLLDPAVDRVADVFPTAERLHAAGYHDQEESDLLAVHGPRLVGITANNIPHFVKALQGRTFSEWQASTARPDRKGPS